MAQQVWPYSLYEDGEAAIEFLTRAFGFREVDRSIGGAGALHAELEAPGGAHPQGHEWYFAQELVS